MKCQRSSFFRPMCSEESFRSMKSTRASSQTSTRTDARSTSLNRRKSPLSSKFPRQQNLQITRRKMSTAGGSHQGSIRTHRFTSVDLSTCNSTQVSWKRSTTDRQLATDSKRSTSNEPLMNDHKHRAGNTAFQTPKCRTSRFTMNQRIAIRLEKSTCEINNQLGDDWVYYYLY